jgi:micrococcal nuclease
VKVRALLLLGVLLAAGVVGAAVFVVDADGRDPATVTRVVDGDTVRVDLDGVETTVRLLNVDAPETKHPTQGVDCLGPEAAAFLTRMLPAGTRVELEYDGEKLDRYGRTLAGVWRQDALVNAEVARAGLGAPVQYNRQVKFLAAVERAAREAERRRVGAYADGVSCALPGRAGRR